MRWLALFTFDFGGHRLARSVHIEADSLPQARRAVRKEFPEAKELRLVRIP